MRCRFRNNWTTARLVGAVALVFVGVGVGIEAWVDIFRIARRDEEASHIFLVPLVAAYLVFVRLGRRRHIRPSDDWSGPAIVALGCAAFYIGDQRLWQSVWHLGAILIAVGSLLTATGIPVLKQFFSAFLVLLFLIPVPGRVRQRIALPMQTATAQITESAFALTDVTVHRRGSVLEINGVDVAIAEACNGLRMVFALTLVCYAFAFGSPLRWYARMLILIASPLAAILCNVIRLVPTVYVYGNYSSKVADDFHVIGGWAMLFIAFLMLLGILRLLRWALIPVYQFTLAYD